MQPTSRGDRFGCPPWCTTLHGALLGEEDLVHSGDPVRIDDDAAARLCMSIDPATGEQDGPFVLIGSTEYSLDETAVLAARLSAMTAAGRAYSASSRNALSRS